MGGCVPLGFFPPNVQVRCAKSELKKGCVASRHMGWRGGVGWGGERVGLGGEAARSCVLPQRPGVCCLSHDADNDPQASTG